MKNKRIKAVKNNKNNCSDQISFFGYDNLFFKTVNLPKPQRFKSLCRKFHIKKVIYTNSILYNYIQI